MKTTEKEDSLTDAEIVAEHTNRLRTLTLYFYVREDLPSERVMEYRQLVIEAMQAYDMNNNCTNAQHIMIDRIMNDGHSHAEAEKLFDLRRKLWTAINNAESGSLEAELIEAQIDVVNEHIDRINEETDELFGKQIRP